MVFAPGTGGVKFRANQGAFKPISHPRSLALGKGSDEAAIVIGRGLQSVYAVPEQVSTGATCLRAQSRIGDFISVAQLGDQLARSLNGFITRRPGSATVVQWRKGFNVNDRNRPGTARKMRQLGHVIPPACDARNVFFHRLGCFYFHWFSF